MTARTDTTLSTKRRDAARRRAHRRIANSEFKLRGTPKSETMKRLKRSHAATVGNRGRWARQRAEDRRVADEYAHDHPPPPGLAYMHKGIAYRIEKMTYHERMERSRLGLAALMMSFNRSTLFTSRTFEDWRVRTLRALTYQRGKYRKLDRHTEKQAETHVLLELGIDFIRQANEPLLQRWLHTRQVAEQEERQSRLKLHNPTASGNF